MPAKGIETNRPDDRGLVESITRFSNLLKDSGVAISLPAVLNTIDGLPLIDIFNSDQFKCLLQANLICRKEDIAIFNQLFHAFWLTTKPSHRFSSSRRVETPQTGESDNTKKFGKQQRIQLPAAEEPASERRWSIRYSPDSLNSKSAYRKIRFAESRAVYEIISRLLQPLNNRLSRRHQYTIRGRQISLRRILRKNMQFGGELIFLDFKKRKVKKRRVVLLCDVSGSMDVYTLMILQFIHALKRIDRRTEIFFFSTDLSRATHQFELKDFDSAMSRIPELISDWGGGTRIGHSLRIFNRHYRRGILAGRDIVIIFSDGWDRGEIDELDSQMAHLKRRAHKIIWLNPLLATRDYQPICQGMRTALPYVDYFLPMSALHDLRLLSRTLAELLI